MTKPDLSVSPTGRLSQSMPETQELRPRRRSFQEIPRHLGGACFVKLEERVLMSMDYSPSAGPDTLRVAIKPLK